MGLHVRVQHICNLFMFIFWCLLFLCKILEYIPFHWSALFIFICHQ